MEGIPGKLSSQMHKKDFLKIVINNECLLNDLICLSECVKFK